MFTIEENVNNSQKQDYVLFWSKKLLAKYNSKKSVHIMVFVNCINLSSQ